jgi:hypothetical protein
MRRIVVRGLSGYTVFFRVCHKGHDFQNVVELNMCVSIFSTNLPEAFPILKVTE